MLKNIIIKVGTNVITRENGLLDFEVMKQLVQQIAELRKKGMNVILISSGAMGAGRGLIELRKDLNDITKRQILASVGQVKLLGTYLKLFREVKFLCSQVLVTKEDFRDRLHYLNMKNCFEGLLHSGITPIVNENDVISVDELMFTDNDELAGLIAAMMNADILIILSNVDGVYDKSPEEKTARILHEISSKMSLQKYITKSKSLFGRGGMLTKAKITQRLAGMGITTFIANGKRHNVLLDILDGKKIGTKFIPEKKRASSVKRWIASREGSEKGVLYINQKAETALREKIASLLPLGITKIEGSFKKGDMIGIKSKDGVNIGVGTAAYGSTQAKKNMGKKGKKALIHYDYLFLQK